VVALVAAVLVRLEVALEPTAQSILAAVVAVAEVAHQQVHLAALALSLSKYLTT
jgi:hypothetical protein